jgi:hypothetical protein|tara:strand:- start:1654 stop:2115 length:462 start_codon:yes stop_codon:yes gene_type:complete
MADKKITALSDLGDALAAADLFHVVDDPTGTPINKKISAENVFNNIPSWLGLNSTSQTLTSDGSTVLAANVTTPVTEVVATAGTATITLADGANGQIKTIINTATGGTYVQTITPSNLRGGTSVLLNAPGETVTLIFKNSNWNIIGGHGYTVS